MDRSLRLNGIRQMHQCLSLEFKILYPSVRKIVSWLQSSKVNFTMVQDMESSSTLGGGIHGHAFMTWPPRGASPSTVRGRWCRVAGNFRGSGSPTPVTSNRHWRPHIQDSRQRNTSKYCSSYNLSLSPIASSRNQITIDRPGADLMNEHLAFSISCSSYCFPVSVCPTSDVFQSQLKLRMTSDPHPVATKSELILGLCSK